MIIYISNAPDWVLFGQNKITNTHEQGIDQSRAGGLYDAQKYRERMKKVNDDSFWGIIS